MNNLQCYIDMEIDSGIKGVGDKLEASQVLSQVEFKMYDNETGELAFEGTGESINFEPTETKKTCLLFIYAT
ncbi:hypothetical protein KEH51_29330 [[Brevibacterium] frigoritolerans]|uniref:Uncharacterized protein n=1 Tax=Peribacillus frigoritolerans TaxID=450367 RepID=A0A941FUM3_9BACI|nr:hypothetical protein [Peribacillus frigoritolerans]